MFLGYFVLIVAIVTSIVSAYYSVTGLATIFAGAFWPIVIMGSTLEMGKLTAALWLHKNWVRAEIQYKIYLVPALGVLMLLTSMGIFGGLSKAHLEQAAPTGDVAAQISLYDEKIATERENIVAAKHALKQMDEQVDQFLGRTDDVGGAAKAVRVRKSQADERATLAAAIASANKEIAAINTLRGPLTNQLRKIENEIGPIKYVAALIYGDEKTNANVIEKSVRWVIIMIVVVFDPLAIVLILAGSRQLAWAREDKQRELLENPPSIIEQLASPPSPITVIAKTLNDEPVTEELLEAAIARGIENIKQYAAINQAPLAVNLYSASVPHVASTVKWATSAVAIPVAAPVVAAIEETPEVALPEIVAALVPDKVIAEDADHDWLDAAVEEVAAAIPDQLVDELVTVQTQNDPDYFDAYGEDREEIEELTDQWIEYMDEMQVAGAHAPIAAIIDADQQSQTLVDLDEEYVVAVNEIISEEDYESDIDGTLLSINEIEMIHAQEVEFSAQIEQEILGRDSKIDELTSEVSALGSQVQTLQAKNNTFILRIEELQEENLLLTGNPINANFGTSYPHHAKKGDMFLRVDHKPSRLFKWNGTGWIEVDKSSTDTYAYDRRYLQYLINKINTGEYSLDELSQPEQDSISELLLESSTTITVE